MKAAILLSLCVDLLAMYATLCVLPASFLGALLFIGTVLCAILGSSILLDL